MALTKAQVKDSPSVDANRPVSRRFESAYFSHFGFAPYLREVLTRQQVERSPRPEQTRLSEAYERRLTAHYGAEHAWGEDPRT